MLTLIAPLAQVGVPQGIPACHQGLANPHFILFAISTDTAFFMLHAKSCFTLPRVQTTRTSNSLVIRVTPNYPQGLPQSLPSLVDRCVRSIITRSHSLT
jgi:hypothetical protein